MSNIHTLHKCINVHTHTHVHKCMYKVDFLYDYSVSHCVIIFQKYVKNDGIKGWR